MKSDSHGYGCVVPELYPRPEGNNSRLKGFAFSAVGTFLFTVTSFAAITLSSQWLFVSVSGLSLASAILMVGGYRSRSFTGQVGFLIAASATLAAETGAVGLIFPASLAAVSALLTLTGSLLAAGGVHLLESLPVFKPLSASRGVDMTLAQYGGGRGRTLEGSPTKGTN